MSIRRMIVLLRKELVSGPKNFMFIFAVVVPIALTLIISLLFGTFFSGKARLGVFDAGHSQFVQLAEQTDSVIVTTYASASELRDRMLSGAADIGIALPDGYDASIKQGERIQATVYVWGESQLQHRAIAAATFASVTRDIAGQDAPVDIIVEPLGDAVNIPWQERLLPFIVLITILIGGSMIPAASIVDEKQKRTLSALTITPTTLSDVYVAKGALGVIVSLVMAVVILTLNQAFGTQPVLLITVLALGAILAATFGVLLGTLVKDINTLFTVLKATGILLYAPAIVYLIPDIPQWIGQLFPTYYIIQPVVEITQQGGTWADVLPELAVLVVLIVALMAVVGIVSRRVALRPA